MLQALEILIHQVRVKGPVAQILFYIFLFGFSLGASLAVGWILGFATAWIQGVSHGFLLFSKIHKNKDIKIPENLEYVIKNASEDQMNDRV